MQTFNMVARLGNEPETKFLPSGVTVTEFRVAVDMGKDKPAAWRKCVAFGSKGDFIAKWFHKGDPIILAGEVQLDTWKDKTTGEDRQADKYIVDHASFVLKPSEKAQRNVQQEVDRGFDDGGDLPF